ncbi:MAG: GNAT family N-acetyltransferase [Acidobacteria bacterium]|nr:GNAT family N-acetyltransferase [Acidobacteriota bacterium]
MLSLTFQPLTVENWADFESLFGERGACGGCWCMWWRLKRAQFDLQKGEANKAAMKEIVATSQVAPGLLAYVDQTPVAWCAIAPRSDYPSLERSRILRRVDDTPVWSVTCLFVAKPYRRQGVTVALLKAAVEYVCAQGGKVVEGYPVEPQKDSMPDVFAWTGLVSAFRKAGFHECLRRSTSRPIMRFTINEQEP